MVLGVILLLVHNCIHYFQLKFIRVLEFLHFQLGSKYLTNKIKFCNKSASNMEVISFSFIYFKFQFVLKRKKVSSSSISWNKIYSIYTSDYSNTFFYSHQSIYLYLKVEQHRLMLLRSYWTTSALHHQPILNIFSVSF